MALPIEVWRERERERGGLDTEILVAWVAQVSDLSPELSAVRASLPLVRRSLPLLGYTLSLLVNGLGMERLKRTVP